jgi:hypothetical protein
MKRCQYCGKEYSDKTAVCPVDGEPLINPEAIPLPSVDRTVFHAALTVPLSLTGNYRIFARGDDLIFIVTEAAAHSILNSIHGFLGPLGIIIPFGLWLFSRHRTKDWNQRLATADPEDLIREDKKNFRVHLSEVRAAVLDPISYWRFTSSKSAVLLTLSIRQNEKLQLQPVTTADVETARHLLVARLPAVLQVNVEWDAVSQRFKKKAAARPA